MTDLMNIVKTELEERNIDYNICSCTSCINYGDGYFSNGVFNCMFGFNEEPFFIEDINSYLCYQLEKNKGV